MPCAAACTMAVLTAAPVLAMLLLLLSWQRGSLAAVAGAAGRGLLTDGQVEPGGLACAAARAADCTQEWMCSCWVVACWVVACRMAGRAEEFGEWVCLQHSCRT
jgi:hypothetical protein